jgi:hypothetical protein
MIASPTFSQRASEIEKLFGADPLIRAVNFHNAPRTKASQIEREIAQYSRYFSSVTEDDLDKYLVSGRWHKAKPGLIVSVYEGYRNGYDVLAPILERHGLIGWFFIITEFIKAPVKDQLAFAQGHDIDMETHEYLDGRYAMTWEEIRQLSAQHVIASHSRSHTKLSLLDSATREREVIGAQEDFEKHLGRRVRSFVSLTGPPYGEFAPTDRLIDAAGYDFVFSNFRIQRVRAD